MTINPLIFRAYDIRGIYGKDINEEIFWKIGFAFGKKGKKYLVGNDIRKSGKPLSLALISGLLAKKAEVFYGGIGSFGQILFSGWKKRVNFTLFVTASHLPPEWNGLKIFGGDGEPIPPTNLNERVLKLKKIKFQRPTIKRINLKSDYLKFLIKKFSDLKNANLKIVIDCGGGSTSSVAPLLFKRLGFTVIEIFCKPDPNFSFRDPEPTTNATKTLRERVLKEKADFGVAFDGDGDRGVIIDDKGRYLRGDQIGVILAKELFRDEKKKIVVKTVSCSMLVDEVLKKFGAKIIEVPVGHTFVGITCKKYKAILGIEESNHLFYPKIYLFDDALLTPLFTARVIKNKKRKLSQLVNEIPVYFFEEINFSCPDEIKFDVIEKLKNNLQKKYQKVNTLDGIKVYFPKGWILIRASNTSPKIKFYVEAKNKSDFKRLKEEFSKKIKKCIQQLS